MYRDGMAQTGNAAKEMVGGFRLKEGIESAPKRTGQIEEQIVIAQKLSESLHSAIQRLQGMIESVLRQEPTCGSDPDKEPNSTVGLVECLREQNRKLAYATERINSMIDRCEL